MSTDNFTRAMVCTWGTFLASNKSGVWNTSVSGTPYVFAAFWNHSNISSLDLNHIFHHVINNIKIMIWLMVIHLEKDLTRKDWMFSINMNGIPFSLNFGTAPGDILFISLHKITPFLRTCNNYERFNSNFPWTKIIF